MSTGTGVTVGVGVGVGGLRVGCGVGGLRVGLPVGVGVGPAEGLVDSIALGVAMYGVPGVELGDGRGSMAGASLAVEVGDGVGSTVGVGAGPGSQNGAPTARLTTARQAARPTANEREIRTLGRRVRTVGRRAINR
jgi:hypothetical protein